jgi:hypothetical protein
MSKLGVDPDKWPPRSAARFYEVWDDKQRYWFPFKLVLSKARGGNRQGVVAEAFHSGQELPTAHY